MGEPASRRPHLGASAAIILLVLAAVAGPDQAEAATSSAVRTFRVGGQPDRVAIGAGAVWVGDSGHLFTVDPTTGAVRTVPDVATPIAVDGDSVWVRPTVHPDTLVRVDPTTTRIAATVPLGGTPAAISIGPHGLWIIDSTGVVTRVDLVTNAVVATIPVGSLGFSITDAGDSVWASGRSADDAHPVVWRIDPTTNTVRAAMTTNANCMTLAGLGDTLWAACGTARRSETDGSLTPTDASALDGIAVGPQAAYALGNDGTVTTIQPTTGRVLHRAVVPPGSEGIAVGAGAVWVANPALSEAPTTKGRGTITRLPTP
jgi:sugar lactone lactonase YvrE